MADEQIQQVTCNICGLDCTGWTQQQMFMHAAFEHPFEMISSRGVQERIAKAGYQLGGRLADWLRGKRRSGLL